MKPPELLIDPEGEGVYLLSDSGFEQKSPGVLLRAAFLFHGDWRAWRDVDHQTVYMRPKEDGSDEWELANIGKHPRGWRLNLPRRWRPVLYAYCTPKVGA